MKISHEICLFFEGLPRQRIRRKPLLEGYFPYVNHYGHTLRGPLASRAGSPVAGGWKAAFESRAGDWKERSLSHQFVKRNYGSTLLCDQCRAIQPHKRTPENLLELVYANFHLDAPWTTTIRDHNTYLDQTPSSQQSPWVSIPGFDIRRVRWDSAHTILLVCGKDIAASFLLDVATRLFPWQAFFLEIPCFKYMVLLKRKCEMTLA